MKNSRLIKLLSSLSKEELKFLKKFLKSPFVRSRRNLAPLLEVLSGHHPEYNELSVAPERIYAELFGKEKFDSKKLENLTTDLLEAAESYLIHQAIDNDEIERRVYLAHAYSDKQMLSQSFRVLKKVESSDRLYTARGQSHYSLIRRINFMKSAFYMMENDFRNNIDCVRNIFKSSVLQAISDFALYESTKRPALTTYNIVVDDSLFESVISKSDIKELLESMKSNLEKEYLPAELNFLKLKVLSDPENEKNYFELKSLFFENIDKFGRHERHITFSHLANYCVQMIVKGIHKFREEGLNVYKEMVRTEAYSLSKSEYMQTLTFRNIVQICMINKDIEWLDYFITNYSDKLPPFEREDRKHYSFAQLHFAKQEFGIALEHASKVRKEFFLFKTDEKNLLLRIYYELGYHEAALSLMDSYKHYLSKSKEVSEVHKISFRTFVKHYNSLLNIKYNQSKENPSFLLQQIDKEQNLVSRQWLIDKATELIRNKKRNIKKHSKGE